MPPSHSPQRPRDRRQTPTVTRIKEPTHVHPAEKTLFGKQPGERVDVEEPTAKTLIGQGIAEAVQGDHLGSLIEK